MKLDGTVVLLAFLGMQIAMADQQTRLPTISDVAIIDKGVDQDSSATECRSFKLSSAQAATFLRSAKIITPQELHYRYIQAPCYVRGTGLVGAKRVKWEVRAAGTGWVEYASGERVLLADPAQQDEVPEDRGQSR